VIAEVKRASPSAGIIAERFDPVATAIRYEAAGASALSVLTDERFFLGRLEDLTACRKAVSLPVLRKDFLIDRYQVAEARAAGADCVLLIAECLDNCTLRDLYYHAHELGLQVLIEIHDPANLDRVLELDPDLLGINNRNLATFETDPGHSIALAARVPAGCTIISESGIKSRADVVRLEQAGIRAILVGESLMRAPDPGKALGELLGKSPPAE
jgi:indole-3-glycerol phosphate synthase